MIDTSPFHIPTLKPRLVQDLTSINLFLFYFKNQIKCKYSIGIPSHMRIENGS